MYGHVNIGKLPHPSGKATFIHTVFILIVGINFRASTQHYENWYSTNINIDETTVEFFPSHRCPGRRKHRVLFSSVWMFSVNTKRLASITDIQERMRYVH